MGLDRNFFGQKTDDFRNLNLVKGYLKELKDCKKDEEKYIRLINYIKTNEENEAVLKSIYPYILMKNKTITKENYDITTGIDLDIMNKYFADIIPEIHEDIAWDIFLKYYLKFVEKSGNFENKILEMVNKIKNSVKPNDVVSLGKAKNKIISILCSLKSFDIEDKSFVEDEIVATIFGVDSNDLKEQKLLAPLKMIIKELAESEKKGIYDYEFIGIGSTSVCFKVGDKVLKPLQSTSNPKYDNLEYNKYLLLPLIRKVFDRTDIGLEIYERVELVDMKKFYTNVAFRNEIKDELYKIFSDLRRQGKVWLDIHPKNIGKLLKENKVYYNSADQIILGESTNIHNKNGNSIEHLSKGEYVIIDNEYILDEDVYQMGGWDIIPNEYFHIFFDRYNREIKDRNDNLTSPQY
jgi:hypothetical protein